MKKLFYIIFLLTTISWGQNFTYSGYIYNSVGSGVQNVEVKLYKRTTPTLNGFTSQNNYNGHSYYRSTGSMTWTAAKVACENMGGHLVTSTSLAENNFLFNLWPNGWIGLTDEVSEGTWRWVTNEPFSWSNWNGGEPNNSNNEDYIQFVGGGKWNDLPNVSLPYVLEFEYIVTYTEWVYIKSVYTDLNGRYTINEVSNPSVEWYLQIDTLSTPFLLENIDAQTSNTKSILRTFTSLDYYKYDVNNDGKINISDSYYIFMKKSGRFSSWGNSLPNSRIFTPSQYSILNSSTIDLRISYPGVQSFTINSPTNGGSSNFYLLRTGKKD
jgi:hypothetical protein